MRIIAILVFLVSMLGSPVYGNYHLQEWFGPKPNRLG